MFPSFRIYNLFSEEIFPETKKEKKIKQRKSPLKINCVSQLGSVPVATLNKFLEVECQLKAKDKEEKDKSDAKNALEELVYAIRFDYSLSIIGKK